MRNTPLVASTAYISALPLSIQLYELTKTVVKCGCGHMRRARFSGSHAVEQQALRRSLNRLELHFHVPKSTMVNIAPTVSYGLPHSRKLEELRSSVTKSGSTTGGFPCMALSPGTVISDEQAVLCQNYQFPTVKFETVIDMGPHCLRGKSEGSGSTIQLARCKRTLTPT